MSYIGILVAYIFVNNFIIDFRLHIVSERLVFAVGEIIASSFGNGSILVGVICNNRLK